jgi:hypothetical protein
MNGPFDFYYAGFRTKYSARPTEQTISIYAGDSYVTFFEAGEMQQMIAKGNIQLAHNEENN